jgi:hypothetical protein
MPETVTVHNDFEIIEVYSFGQVILIKVPNINETMSENVMTAMNGAV